MDRGKSAPPNNALLWITNSVTVQPHILFVRTPAGPTPIFLSRQYTAACDVENKRVTISDGTYATLPVTEEFGVASFHTLYGANGSGKTQLLLDVRQTFSRGSKRKPLAIFFVADGKEQIYQGTLLGGWTVVLASEPVRRVTQPPEIVSVFYTTSPFEYSRRNRYAAQNALDVSPSIGHSVSFDGLALLDKYDVLPAAIRERARIRVRINMLTLDQVLEQFVSPLRQRKEPVALHLTRSNIKEFISGWLKALSSETQNLVRISVALAETESSDYRWRAHACDLLVAHAAKKEAIELTDDDSDAILHDLLTILSSGDVQWQSRIRKISDYCTRLFPDGKTKTSGPLTLESFGQFIGASSASDRALASSAAKAGVMSFSVSNMSSGETAYMVLLASLSSAIKMLETQSPTPIFFLIDEGEMFMHPEWQRCYVSKILELLKESQVLAGYIHVLITTHSLIVAADSPPNALINVETGEHANGFGLGPKFVLKDVYGVDSFAGALSQELLSKLDQYMRSRDSAVSSKEAARIAESLADRDLQRYVKNEIVRRGGTLD